MTDNFTDKNIINIAEKILSKYNLCSSCLGRVFAKIEKGITNNERGEKINKIIKKDLSIDDGCWLCAGLVKEIPHFVNLVLDSLKDYEFENFLIGTKIDEDIKEREQELFEFTESNYEESIKMELNREIGKILEEKIEKVVNFDNPEIMVIIDTVFDDVILQIDSLFIYGRYKKLKRGVPQTKWYCRICRGKGCKMCNYTGKMYNSSVEELVAKQFLKDSKGSDELFHGCGREDIDVLMLGTGRPFVLEIKNPKVRKLDLSKIKQTINTNNKGIIEINNLRFTDKDEVMRIKSANFSKTYQIVVKGKKALNKEKLKKAAQRLQSETIKQFTPSRVAHRRANMVREKKIYKCTINSVEANIATLTVESESGTYIKELISGDTGKTKPNLSEIIGVPCKVAELDVINIKGE
jgi:tRNA pseudouridine synthase 10